MNNRTIIKEAKSIVRQITHYENINMNEERKEEILQSLDWILFQLMAVYADNEKKKGRMPGYLSCTVDFRKWLETGEE